jgi:hypothetical protein
VLKRALFGWVALVLGVGCRNKPRAVPVANAAPLEIVRNAAPLEVAPAPELPPPPGASPAPELPRAPEPDSRCNEQTAQDFLKAAHFDSNYALGEEHRRQWAGLLMAAVRYRTEQYGYVEGYGSRAWNSRTPLEQGQTVKFFGVPVTVHARVVPALACVESAIRAHCASEPYQPGVLSGLRRRNTYLNGEISNHVYGIAIDIDPMRNPCCGCVGSWRENERCRNHKTKFERMDMPKCWITEFERFGFYWLGHDRIEDTMHFEFLADPSRITR